MVEILLAAGANPPLFLLTSAKRLHTMPRIELPGRVKPVNKKELAAAVATASDMTTADALKAIDATLDTITETLKAGDEVRLLGFGTFKTAHRKAGTGRNPQTGKEIQIAASTQAKFSAGKGLKDALNG